MEISYKGEVLQVQFIPFNFNESGITNSSIHSLFPCAGRTKFWGWETYPATEEWDAVKKQILKNVPDDKIYMAIMDGDPFAVSTAKGRDTRVVLFNAVEGVNPLQDAPTHWVGVVNNGLGASSNWMAERPVHYAQGGVY